MAAVPVTPERSRSSSIDTIRMTPGTSTAPNTPSPATVTGPNPPDLAQRLNLVDRQPHSIIQGLNKSAPLAGNVYILKSASSDKLVGWIDWCQTVGTIPAAASSSIEDQTPLHWKCVRHGGWFGLMNVGTGRFLGRDGNNYIICAQVKQLGWERFAVEPVEGGAFILRQEHEGLLYPIAVRYTDDGHKRMAKLMDVDASGYALEFYEVPK